MGRSVKEKLEFNQNKKTDFAFGYRLGVALYRDYPKYDKKGKAEAKRTIDSFNLLARSGDEISKGVMCAYRDCAQERKAKKK